MKLFIATMLIAIAFVPFATAGVSEYAQAYSGTYGDCQTGNYGATYNRVSGAAYTTSAGAGANAGTTCYAYYDFFSGQIVRYNSIDASAVECNAQGCVYVGVQWSSLGSTCNTTVYASGQPTQNLGCPAGKPPVVPALLP